MVNRMKMNAGSGPGFGPGQFQFQIIHPSPINDSVIDNWDPIVYGQCSKCLMKKIEMDLIEDQLFILSDVSGYMTPLKMLIQWGQEQVGHMDTWTRWQLQCVLKLFNLIKTTTGTWCLVIDTSHILNISSFVSDRDLKSYRICTKQTLGHVDT